MVDGLGRVVHGSSVSKPHLPFSPFLLEILERGIACTLSTKPLILAVHIDGGRSKI